VSDPTTVKDLMRHTSLNTTTLYARTVTERMKEAVQNLGKSGASLGAKKGAWRIGGNTWGQVGSNAAPKSTQNGILQNLTKLLAAETRAPESGEFNEGNLRETSVVVERPFDARALLHTLEMRCDVGEA